MHFIMNDIIALLLRHGIENVDVSQRRTTATPIMQGYRIRNMPQVLAGFSFPAQITVHPSVRGPAA